MCRPAICRPTSRTTSTPSPISLGRRRHVRHLRRGAVQPRPGERRLQLRPLPHARLELGRTRRHRSGRVRLEPHRRPGEHRSSPTEDDMIDFIKTGSVQRRQVRRPGPGQRPHARVRCDAHRRTDPGDRRVRAEFVMLSTLLAVGWEPELRGILTVMIGVDRVDGLDLSHPRHQPRCPPRLHRDASPASSAGWRSWVASGGSTASASRVTTRPGSRSRARTVIQEVDLLHQAGVLDEPDRRRRSTTPSDEAAGAVVEISSTQGWAAGRGVGARVRSGRRRRPKSSSKKKVRSVPASTPSRPCTRSTRPTSRRTRSSARTASSTRSRSSTSRTTRSSRSLRTMRVLHRAGSCADRRPRSTQSQPASVRLHDPRSRLVA